MNPKILVTLGPSSFNNEMIKKMAAEDVYLFRINLSHTAVDEVEGAIKIIQESTDVPACLDSEGAQMRSHKMKNGGVLLAKDGIVKIHFGEVVGDQENISFSPGGIAAQFEVGDKIAVDFDSVSLEVIEKLSDYCLSKVECGGVIGSNKAANIVNRPLALESISTKDRQAIEIGRQMNVRHFALSFANSSENVHDMRELIGPESTLISKVESYQGLKNLVEIIDATDEVLIDRGDLSREVSLVKIPFLQRRIVSSTKSMGKDVFVATNLLESMILRMEPTRAEINDVVSTLLMGADGLVLAAETAVGNFPYEAVRKIRLLIEQYLRWTPNTTIDELLNDRG